MKTYLTASMIQEQDIKEHICGILRTIYSEDNICEQYLINTLGGNVYVAETPVEACTFMMQPGEGDPMLACAGKYYEIVVMNNNTGGPSYYIPTELVVEATCLSC